MSAVPNDVSFVGELAEEGPKESLTASAYAYLAAVLVGAAGATALAVGAPQPFGPDAWPLFGIV
ncbi:MAG: hypothetical protein M3304_10635, partial [Actinomycetota bacterium]|nr:hypothetical protein [Actinomycetota bacterium]